MHRNRQTDLRLDGGGRRMGAASICPQPHRTSRAALTLLEVILAIALTSIVMLLVSMAIDFQLRATERRRADAEQAQIVRAVLQQMSTDLRGSLYAKTTDFSGVADLPAAQLGDLNSELTGEAGAEGAAAIDEAADEAADIASSITSSELPGLFGNRYELVFDISHLPNRYELARIAAAGESAGPSGDVKSVAYYLAALQQPGVYSDQAGGTAPFNPENELAQIGLVRRVIDRAAVRWAAGRGEADFLLDNAELIAPEVRALEFRYFDGVEWLEQWNSDDLLGLPVAVEIIIAFAPTDEYRENLSMSELRRDIAPGQYDPDSIFRTVVRLPTGQPLDEEALIEAEEQANTAGEEESQ
ncbi:MAG: hypothetical protein VB876_17075 [Pirellulales bacterium]